MKRLRIYLDTSVISMLLADDAPEFTRITREFFETCVVQHELFVSEVALDEVSRTPDAVKRDAMVHVLEDHDVVVLDTVKRAEVVRLADLYVARAIISSRKMADALHVGYAVVYGMDILLSWNFRHLANVRKETLFAAVNIEEGYKLPLRLASPMEVLNEDK